MSQKLSTEAALASLCAIQEYMNDFSGTNKKRVIARKENEIIFNDTVSVITGDYNIYYKVDIIWEEVDSEFKERGLYGTYSSTYYRIEYDGDMLIIYADDIQIEII